MPLRPVQSSRIKALGYDQDTWTCYVQFQPTRREPKGTVYAYANVSPEMFAQFEAAPSKGRFFGENLAEHGDHPALRLGEPHTSAGAAPRSPSVPAAGVLMFRPSSEGTPTAALTQTGRTTRSQGSSVLTDYAATSEELVQLSRERELLLEFFRPMRESTLAAYRAVVEKEEEALAQFQAAEAALAAQLQGSSRRASGSGTGK